MELLTVEVLHDGKEKVCLFYLYTLAVSPSLGGRRQHKENNKTLRSSSNDEGPGFVYLTKKKKKL